MKILKNNILFFTLFLLIALVSCKKDDVTTSTTPDPSAQSEALLKNYQAAITNDPLLVNYHQHALNTGNHDSCYIYWHQFNQYDSLFSFNFYEYCRIIYANNGGHNYGNDEWNWNHDNGMGHHENWQCGLDTLQFQNWYGFGDCWEHDSLMYHQMQGYGMTGYFSNQVLQCYSNMQALRENHYKHHNFHW